MFYEANMLDPIFVYCFTYFINLRECDKQVVHFLCLILVLFGWGISSKAMINFLHIVIPRVQ